MRGISLDTAILDACESTLEIDFYMRWASRESYLHLPDPMCQVKFDSKRNWRADFTWQAAKVMAEIDGRWHATYKRHVSDCEKQNDAAAKGYLTVRFTANMITDKRILQLCKILEARMNDE